MAARRRKGTSSGTCMLPIGNATGTHKIPHSTTWFFTSSFTVAAKLRFLRECGSAGESLLFGLAGFLEDPEMNRTALAQHDYWRGLWQPWWRRSSQLARQ